MSKLKNYIPYINTNNLKFYTCHSFVKYKPDFTASTFLNFYRPCPRRKRPATRQGSPSSVARFTLHGACPVSSAWRGCRSPTRGLRTILKHLFIHYNTRILLFETQAQWMIVYEANEVFLYYMLSSYLHIKYILYTYYEVYYILSLARDRYLSK